MDKKLTLSLNAVVVEQAKGYAKDHGISLSRMIENYLASLVSEAKETDEVYSPLVTRLIGVIDLNEGSVDYKGDYADYLIEKYQ